MDKIMVFIPMYNCEKQIVRVLEQFNENVCKYVDEIVIINNRSTDKGEKNAIKFLKKMQLNIKKTVLRNNDNYNLGGSHKVAFDYAIKNHYNYLIVLHGDDQGNINDLVPFLESKEYKKYDCFLGSRFMKGSKLKGYSKFRTFGNRVYNIIFSIMLFKNISDLGSGLNVYDVDCLKNKYYLKYPDRLTFNCYMLLASNYFKQKIKFFPITWREDDQISNVKMMSQAFTTLGLVFKYFIFRGKYLEKDHRSKIIENYEAKVIYESSGEVNEK